MQIGVGAYTAPVLPNLALVSGGGWAQKPQNFKIQSKLWYFGGIVVFWAH